MSWWFLAAFRSVLAVGYVHRQKGPHFHQSPMQYNTLAAALKQIRPEVATSRSSSWEKCEDVLFNSYWMHVERWVAESTLWACLNSKHLKAITAWLHVHEGANGWKQKGRVMPMVNAKPVLMDSARASMFWVSSQLTIFTSPEHSGRLSSCPTSYGA